MPRRAEHLDRRERRLRGSELAAAVVTVGVLLFTWPFVRTPLLVIGLSYAHLLAAWAVVVGGLFLLSRRLAGTGRPRGDRA